MYSNGAKAFLSFELSHPHVIAAEQLTQEDHVEDVANYIDGGQSAVHYTQLEGCPPKEFEYLETKDKDYTDEHSVSI